MKHPLAVESMFYGSVPGKVFIGHKYIIVSVGVLGTGVPRLACLRPAAWLKWWPSATHLHPLKLKTLARGQTLRGGRQEASSGVSSPGKAREEAERSRQGYLARCS
ncbi:hypothetical protein VPH35_009166 [Triticum aestivum]